MKLRWKEFEQRLGSRIQREVALPRVSRWQRINWWLQSSPPIPLWVVGILFLLFAGFVGLALISDSLEQGHLNAVVSFFTLGAWMMVLMCRGIFWDIHGMAANTELKRLRHYPVSGTKLFCRQWRILRLLSVFVFLEAIFLYGAIAWQHGLSFSRFLWILGLAILQSITILQGAVLLPIPGGKPPSGLKTILKMILLYALTFALFLESLPILQQAAVTVLYWTTPMGWVHYAMVRGLIQHEIWALWMLAPVAAFACCLPLSKRWAAKRFLAADRHNVMPKSFPQKLVPKTAITLSPEQAAASIQQREFLQPDRQYTEGWVERFVRRRLNPREHVLLEFFWHGSLQWTYHFNRIILWTIWLVVALWFCTPQTLSPYVAWGLPMIHIKKAYWPAINGTIPAACQYLSKLLSVAYSLIVLSKGLICFANSGCGAGQWSGRKATYSAYHYPICFWEGAGLSLKVHALLLACLVPVFLIVCYVCEMGINDPSLPIFWMGMKSFLLLFALLPTLVALPPAMSMSFRRWFREGVALLLFILAFVGMTLGYAALILDQQIPWITSLALCGLVAAISVFFYRRTGRLFQVGQSDLHRGGNSSLALNSDNDIQTMDLNVRFEFRTPRRRPEN